VGQNAGRVGREQRRDPFTAGTTRTVTPEVEAFAKKHGLGLTASYDGLLGHTGIDAVVLATPHSMHATQVMAAAAAGKHVYCEKRSR